MKKLDTFDIKPELSEKDKESIAAIYIFYLKNTKISMQDCISLMEQISIIIAGILISEDKKRYIDLINSTILKLSISPEKEEGIYEEFRKQNLKLGLGVVHRINAMLELEEAGISRPKIQAIHSFIFDKLKNVCISSIEKILESNMPETYFN